MSTLYSEISKNFERSATTQDIIKTKRQKNTNARIFHQESSDARTGQIIRATKSSSSSSAEKTRGGGIILDNSPKNFNNNHPTRKIKTQCAFN